MHYAHLCSVCRSGYAHGPLNGLGETSYTLEEGIAAAEKAMRSLDAKAKSLLALVSVEDPSDEQMRFANDANLAIRFANVTAPISINRAKSLQDLDELTALQRGLNGVLNIVKANLRTSIIDKFLGMGFLKKQIKQTGDVVEDVLGPILPNIGGGTTTYPWYVYAGGGVVALGIIGYFVRSVR